MENQQQTTTLCRAGCGFYGSPSTEGLCSKCYKDYVKRKQDTTACITPPMPAVVNATNAVTATSSVVNNATCNAESTAATSTTVIIAEKLKEVSCSQAAKSSEDMTAQLESVAASVEAVGCVTASSSGTCSGVLSTTSSVVSLDTAVAPDHITLNSEGQTVPKKTNRCHVCKKRVGLTGFVCRCGGLYCGEHRYDTAHGCSFDYKTMEREEIRKNNPVIVSEKIQRI